MCALAVCLLSVVACTTTPAQQTELMRTTTKIEVPAAELRVAVRALAPQLAGIIEESGVKVLREHPDEPVIRRAALDWMTNAIPELNRALYQTDPAGALVDAAAFVAQARQFIEEDPGSELPPPVRSAALEACKRLRTQISAMVREHDANADVERGWTQIDEWAANHPIDTSFASRASTAGLLARLTASGHIGGLKAVSVITEEVEDLADRIDLLGQYGPKLARWHAEILIEQVLYERRVMEAFESAKDIPLAIRAVNERIDKERVLILEDVAREREIVQAWARGERLETLDYATAERIVILEAVAAERMAVLDYVATERERLLEALRNERAATVAELERIVTDTLVGAREEIIDHAALRIAQLGAVGFVALALLVVGAANLIRRR